MLVQTLRILHQWSVKTLEMANSFTWFQTRNSLLFISPLVPQIIKVISGKSCLSRSFGNCFVSWMWPMVIYFSISATVGNSSVVHPISRRITNIAIVLSERPSCTTSPVLLPSERGIMLNFAPTELTEESDFSPASSNYFETEWFGESSAWSTLGPNSPTWKSVFFPAWHYFALPPLPSFPIVSSILVCEDTFPLGSFTHTVEKR